MYQIILKKNNKIIKTYNLDPNKEYIIGREPNCDIVLDTTLGVSRQHAKLLYSDPDWVLENISVTNPVMSQGTAITILLLKENSTFSIEKFDFLFTESTQNNQQEAHTTSDNTHLDHDEENATHDDDLQKTNAIHNEQEPPDEELQEEDLEAQDELDHLTSNEEGHTSSTTEEENESLENKEHDEPLENEDKKGILEDENPIQNIDGSLDNILGSDQNNTSSNFESNADKTVVHTSPLKAYIVVEKDKKSSIEKTEITSESWVVGRDKECNTVIKTKTLSRFHFEITHQKANYYITDLGSTNGTRLNEKKLKAKSSIRLKSGDSIRVKSIKIKFYLSKKSLDSEIHLPALPSPPQIQSPSSRQIRHKKRVWILAAISFGVFVLALSLYQSKDKQTPSTHTKNSPTSNAEKEILEDMLKLAQFHFSKGKYQLCLEEIKKIKAINPDYKHTKSMETYCSQSYKIQQDKLLKQIKIQEQAELEGKLLKITQGCKKQFDEQQIDLAGLEKCLYPAIVINPQHHYIVNVKAHAESIQEAKKEKVRKQKNYQRLLKKGTKKYNDALKLFQKKQWKEAIDTLDDFIEFKFSGTNYLKKEAKNKRKIAKLKLSELITALLNQGETAIDEKDYKKAYTTANKVIFIYPKHKKAKALKEKAFKLIKKEAKNLYQDAIFEESVGNIAIAKDKWKEILKISLPGETYYERAKDFLRKYGDY